MQDRFNKVDIIAHENMSTCLKETDKKEGFLPVKFMEEELKLSLVDQSNLIIHVHSAHTDRDSFV